MIVIISLAPWGERGMREYRENNNKITLASLSKYQTYRGNPRKIGR
jgi:hypothetical protein